MDIIQPLDADRRGEYDQGQIEEKVASAVSDLFETDFCLFEVDANERSITHRFACHLDKRFESWDVDCEYNRDGDGPKRMQHRNDRVPPDDAPGGLVLPDIIVHRRGSSDNLLVIEVKKSTSQVSLEADLEKLCGFKQQLGYRFGLFIRFVTGEAEPAVVESRWV